MAAIGDNAWVTASRAHNRKWREWLAAEVEALGNHGLKAVPSHANFLLVLFEGALTAQAAFSGLMDAGYATRWLPGQGLPHALRITIGTEAQMRDVARLLREMTEMNG
jgi:histidinol-phosphate aminotransferase